METADLQKAVRAVPDFPEPGILFQDITPVLADPALLRAAVEALAAPFEAAGVTKVVGIEARGFILGGLLAERLGAGFVPMRKAGHLPRETVRRTYALEYGADTIEMHADATSPRDRVLIHDDVIATGGTAQAAQRLIEDTGAAVAGFSFFVELAALEGQQRLAEEHAVHVVLSF